MNQFHRSPTIRIVEQDGLQQLCMIFENEKYNQSFSPNIKEVNFKKMKPYRGIQMSIL